MIGDEHRRSLIAQREDTDSANSLLREAVNISEPSATVALRLMPGDVLAERFIIEQLMGSGGMGTIHRGKDLLTQELVAIKVMAPGRFGDTNRFAQEAVVLAELSHLAIVRYLTHGQTPDGTQFLAMEWLDGEDLSERLARSPLTVNESLALLRRTCEGIAVAHARGIVHRDLKPSNLFLVNRDPASVKVLDFGIARRREGTGELTQAGTVLGTVGYMSPEQAMGARNVDARADVFALGCVLFECLAGRAAFMGPNAVAVLAKVLSEEPPRADELRPEIGGALVALVARMLAKNPDARPNDAKAVLSALDALEDPAGSVLTLAGLSEGLTRTEQKIVSVILAAPPSSAWPQSESTDEQLDADMSRIQELTQQFGVEPIAIRGGGLLVVLADRGAATDQASQAARCALLLGRLRPDLRLAVATGRAQTTQRIPVGAAIDRAAELIAGASESTAGVALDELTAGLLDPSFDVRRQGVSLTLVGQRVDLEATRLLMGKPTRFVGRDKELGLLELTLRECIDDHVARAVLVTGPPGQGKSRLRHEFVKKVRANGGVKILIARADPVGAGSTLTLVRQLVRHAIARREDAPASEQYANLRAHIATICQDSDVARVSDFLGELVGAPSSEPSPELRAARDDAQTMRVWLRRSFGEWLSAECAAMPVLVVLEDLHWGDLPSLSYLGEALGTLVAQPLMVLALARPEVHDAFPNLWPGLEKIELPLNRLTPRAAERLMREALGDGLSAQEVSRTIERAGGNAFYLEELIRCVANGDGQRVPETVLALVQSRLERLDSEARRFVRAASIFGEACWLGGVVALVRTNMSPGHAEAQLQSLVAAEVLTVASASRFPGEREYRFRHNFLREAAYAMLSASDRATGHGLAGDWLERAGEKDALTLADHFEHSEDRSRAVAWLLWAASTARNAGSMEAAIELVGRGLDCDPDESQRGLLHLAHVSTLQASGDYGGCITQGHKAMALLPHGSTEWFTCVALMFQTATYIGDREVATPLLHAIRNVPVRAKPTVSYLSATHPTCMGLAAMGAIDTARDLFERIEALSETAPSADPRFTLRLHILRAALDLRRGEVGGPVNNLARARILAENARDAWGRTASAAFSIAAFGEAGSYERAETAAHELSSCPEMSHWGSWSALFLGGAMVLADRTQNAIESLAPLLDHADRYMATSARACLAKALLGAHELEAAFREASIALSDGAMFPGVQTWAFTVLGAVELRRERPADALAFAEQARSAASAGERSASVDSSLGLLRAEALYALGSHESARETIRAARERVLRIAATLDDPELRVCYTTNISANARTLELAHAWLGEVSP